jgi:Uma2 family endonuclease
MWVTTKSSSGTTAVRFSQLAIEPIMASTGEQLEQRITLHQVPWSAYRAFLSALGEYRLRHTYDRGEFEMMSPSREHERIKRLIARLIDAISLEWNIPVQSTGSTTMARDTLERGIEPDETYYVAHEPQVRGRDDYDADSDPPPDLAVEVDHTTSSVSRLPIYSALGVPEIWRYHRGAVSFHLRQPDGIYREVDRSQAFPRICATDISRFIADRNRTDETTWVRGFVQWLGQLPEES